LKSVLGVDVGSVSVKMVILAEDKTLWAGVYLETAGTPIQTIRDAIREIHLQAKKHKFQIDGVGVTGSGRHIAALLLGADLVKNEVTSQTIAALDYNPNISSIIEVGGQDSKVIILEKGVPLWHNLNTLCAAGTGSFLTSQAHRLKIPIEKFGEYASRSKREINIASKCAVFAESDMVHKAALGCSKEDIIKGLCEGLVRNFINNVSRNRPLKSPTLFAGGVAANQGVVRAFEKELGHSIIVPEEHKIMGCIGVALLTLRQKIYKTNFKGFKVSENEISPEQIICKVCPNQCEITKILVNNKIAGHLNSRCGKY